MDEPSGNRLRDTLERLFASGLDAVVDGESDLGAIFRRTIDGVRGRSTSRSHDATDPPVSVRAVGESLFALVRSVDSLDDLMTRLRSSRHGLGAIGRRALRDGLELLRVSAHQSATAPKEPISGEIVDTTSTREADQEGR